MRYAQLTQICIGLARPHKIDGQSRSPRGCERGADFVLGS